MREQYSVQLDYCRFVPMTTSAEGEGTGCR